MTNSKDISYHFLESEDIEVVIDINTEFFRTAEPTSAVMNVSRERYRMYASHITRKAFEDKSCLVARYRGKICGYLIWENYDKPLVYGLQTDEEVMKAIAPEIAIVGKLEENLESIPGFGESRKSKLLQVAVLPEYQNHGIGSQLLFIVLLLLINGDYNYALADCTSEFSYRILINNGFETFTEIAYDDFIHDGVRTFSGIEGYRRLMVKRLTERNIES